MDKGKLLPQDESCIQANYILLKENIDADVLSDELYQNNVISRNDKEDITSLRTKNDKNESLLGKVLNAGPNSGFNFFLSALKKYHPSIHKQLEAWRKTKQRGKEKKDEDLDLDSSETESFSLEVDTICYNQPAELEESIIEIDGATCYVSDCLGVPNVALVESEELQLLSNEKISMLLDSFRPALESLRKGNFGQENKYIDDLYHLFRLICYNDNTIYLLESRQQHCNISDSETIANYIIDCIKESLRQKRVRERTIPLPLLLMSLEIVISNYGYNCNKRNYDCLSDTPKKNKLECKILELFAHLMSEVLHTPITKEELINLQKTFFITVLYLVKDKKMWGRKRDLNEVQQILQDNINHSDKVIKVLSCCLHQSIQEGPVDSADDAIRLCVQWVKQAKGNKKFRAANGLDIVLLLSVLEIFSLKDINIIEKIDGEEFVDLLIALLKVENRSLPKSKLLNIKTSAMIIIYALATVNHYQACLDYKKTLEVIDVYTDCEDLTLKVMSTLTMTFLCDNFKQEIKEIKGDVLDMIVQWLSFALQMPNKKFGKGFHARHLIQSLNKIVGNQNNLKKLTQKIYELQESVIKQDDTIIKEIYEKIKSKLVKSNSQKRWSVTNQDRENEMSTTSTDHGKGTINRKKNKNSNYSKDIDILLIGKTGNGKSATGNSVLNRDVFEYRDSAESVTSNVHHEYTEFKGRKIKVVDGPGVEDTGNMKDLEKATEVMIEKMQDAVLNHPDGYHAFLLVVKYGGRFTSEDKKVVEMLKSIFGQHIVKDYCIILMTHGDVYRSNKQNRTKKFGKWLSEQTGVLKELLEECGNRAVLFDNNSEDPQIREKQMKKLIKVIDRLQYSGRRYCDKHFESAEERRKCLLVECKEPRITENIRKECSLLLERAKNISQYEPEEHLSELKILLAEAENLKIDVLKSDQGTGVLTAAVNLSSYLCVTIESQINIFNTKREKIEIEKEKAEITKNYEEKIKQFEEEYKRQAFEATTFRQSLMKKSIEEKFSQDIQQIQVLETKIQELEEKLNEQTQLHQSNLNESQKKYEEMIDEMIKKLDELTQKYSTVGKRLKNLCKQQ